MTEIPSILNYYKIFIKILWKSRNKKIKDGKLRNFMPFMPFSNILWYLKLLMPSTIISYQYEMLCRVGGLNYVDILLLAEHRRYLIWLCSNNGTCPVLNKISLQVTNCAFCYARLAWLLDCPRTYNYIITFFIFKINLVQTKQTITKCN